MEKDNTKPTISYNKMTFEEYDAGISSLNGRTILHKPSKKLWFQSTLAIEGCCIQYFQEGAANSYESETANDCISVGFALEGPSRIKVNGVQLNKEKLGLLRPGDSIATYAEDINNYCIISFPKDQFLNTCKAYDPHIAEQLMGGPCILDVGPTGCGKVLGQVNDIVRAILTGETFSYRKAREVAIQELLAVILETASHTSLKNKPGRPRFPLKVTIKKIQEYLAESQNRSTSVTEMARYVGSSERKLRQDVNMLFGISPIKLLSLCKMHDIRLSLLDAKPRQTVTEILAAHGVWEMGRFAARYKHLFNKYPSETIT